MKKTLIVIGSLVVLVVVALLVAPAFIPVETYKTELLKQVEKATGRKARIDGDFAIALLPRAELTAGKFSLANAPGGKAPTLVSLDRLNVRIAILPLLSGTVVVDSFVLEKPVISLEVDREGRANWAFAPAGAKPAAAPGAAGGGGAPALGGLQLGDVRLVAGRVSYSDARSGAAYAVDDINMAVALPSLSSPMKADGSLVYNKEKIALKLGVAKPDALLAGDETALDAAVEAALLKLKFNGKARTGAAVKAAGTLDLDVPSVRKLAAWAGAPLTAPGDGFGPLKITGTVSVDGQKYGFTKARLALDKIKGEGDFRFDGGGRLPYVNARLDLGQLDLNPYLPQEQKAAAAKPAPGAAKQAGWSDAPIDLSGLRKANADAELNVEGLQVRKIKVGRSQIKLALKDGQLVTDLTRMALYGGNGKARLSVNGAGAVPAVGATFDLSGLQANPALSDAIDLDRIEGTLATDLNVRTAGNSQRAMVSALGGNGKIKFTDGAIRGINLGAMVRNVSSAFLDPKAREAQKTDFAELSGTFTIRNGIVTNNDLALLSPLLRVGGKGTVDMPNQTLNYRIEPKLAATTTGQGGKADVAGVMVPVIASGPWNDISYRPDLAGMIGDVAKDPTKALEGVKKLVPGLPAPSGGSTPSTPALPKPADALKNLFGR